MTEDRHATDAGSVYDAVATDYVAFVGTEISDATEDAVDRAVLAAFVELAGTGSGPAADLGCGPGRVAALLHRAGLVTIGLDIATTLLQVATGAHPAIPFAGGRLDALPFSDGALGGAVAWYSIIYTPPVHLDAALREIRRVLAPGSPLLLAFQAGPADPVRRTDAFGSGHPLTTFRHDPDDVATRLVASSFTIHATTRRNPAKDHEETAQAFVVAR